MAAPQNLSLVNDPEVFLRNPAKPLLRDHQLAELRACFSGELAHVKPIHAWVHGPPGVGKTLCVRHLLKEPPAGALPVYVNCRERFTFLSVVESVLDAVKPLRSPQRTREHQLAVLRKEFAEKRSVLVLDEVDVLKETEVSNLLHHLCEFPGVSVICVASSRQPLLKLPEAVRSRLAPRQVLFPRYRPEETMVILEHAAEQGLKKGAWAPEALQKIADHSYGDARRAFALLRHGVQRAEEVGSPRLQVEHLKVSNINHFNPWVEDQLDCLSFHHRMLYELVCSQGPVPGTQLEDAYRNVCDRQGVPALSSRSIKNYLDTLCLQKILRREHGPGTPGWIYRVTERR
jgi:archaeal cell division control protein 6